MQLAGPNASALFTDVDWIGECPLLTLMHHWQQLNKQWPPIYLSTIYTIILLKK